jgi:hypothetical protein
MAKLLAGIVAAIVAGILIWQVLDDSSETEQLQDAFNEGTNCGENGTPTRETLDAQALAEYTRSNAQSDGQSFARFVRRTKPELTVIACQVGGSVVRYYAFSDRAQAEAAVAVHGGNVCLAESALIDLGGSHLPDYCRELSGEMRG